MYGMNAAIALENSTPSSQMKGRKRLVNTKNRHRTLNTLEDDNEDSKGPPPPLHRNKGSIADLLVNTNRYNSVEELKGRRSTAHESRTAGQRVSAQHLSTGLTLALHHDGCISAKGGNQYSPCYCRAMWTKPVEIS